MFPLFGSGKNKPFDIKTYSGAEPKTLLVDYFERTVGTPEKQPYTELVLYTLSDTHALLERYEDGGTPEQTVTCYRIPLEGAQQILNAVKSSGMASWNRLHKPIAICGRAYVCKFPDGKGGYTRAGSDRMPEDGCKKFGEVCAAMYAHMKEEYRQ